MNLHHLQETPTLRVCAQATPENVVPKSTAMRSFRSAVLSSSTCKPDRSDVTFSIFDEFKGTAKNEQPVAQHTKYINEVVEEEEQGKKAEKGSR